MNGSQCQVERPAEDKGVRSTRVVKETELNIFVRLEFQIVAGIAITEGGGSRTGCFYFRCCSVFDIVRIFIFPLVINLSPATIIEE